MRIIKTLGKYTVDTAKTDMVAGRTLVPKIILQGVTKEDHGVGKELDSTSCEMEVDKVNTANPEQMVKEKIASNQLSEHSIRKVLEEILKEMLPKYVEPIRIQHPEGG